MDAVSPGKSNMYHNVYHHPLAPCTGRMLMDQVVSSSETDQLNVQTLYRKGENLLFERSTAFRNDRLHLHRDKYLVT